MLAAQEIKIKQKLKSNFKIEKIAVWRKQKNREEQLLPEVQIQFF